MIKIEDALHSLASDVETDRFADVLKGEGHCRPHHPELFAELVAALYQCRDLFRDRVPGNVLQSGRKVLRPLVGLFLKQRTDVINDGLKTFGDGRQRGRERRQHRSGGRREAELHGFPFGSEIFQAVNLILRDRGAGRLHGCFALTESLASLLKHRQKLGPRIFTEG